MRQEASAEVIVRDPIINDLDWGCPLLYKIVDSVDTVIFCSIQIFTCILQTIMETIIYSV